MGGELTLRQCGEIGGPLLKWSVQAFRPWKEGRRLVRPCTDIYVCVCVCVTDRAQEIGHNVACINIREELIYF